MSPRPRRSVTNSTDLQVLSRLTIVTAPLTPPPPKLRGRSPQPGRSVTTSHRPSGSIESDDCDSPAHTATTEAAGTVPAAGSLCNE
ncbi:MAG UNVERIFIED_CONTAM: hypothetical protein LVR18_15985 [Planctomycetaceae bacterium]